MSGRDNTNILQEIAAYTRGRIEAKKRVAPLEEVRARAESLSSTEQTGSARPIRGEKRIGFAESLAAPGMRLICECKKASPSKGLIAPEFPYLAIAKDYEAAGAAAISVLTEPNWFLGSDAYLEEIARSVTIPCLRKDFTVDPYMIYEAKVLGASAVLLICAILSKSQLGEYLSLTHELGMDALVETHSEEEIRMAAESGARIIGVNNRDLKTFHVDLGNTARLKDLIPEDRIAVSESGIRTPEDVAALRGSGIRAALVGEALMRSPDRKQALREFLKGSKEGHHG